MSKTPRFSAAVTLIVCLAGSGWSETVFAEGRDGTETDQAQQMPIGRIGSMVIGEHTLQAMKVPASPFEAHGSQAFSSTSLAQRHGWYRGRGHRNGAAQAEMVVGAVAAIAGAAVLTYANRPECDVHHGADGCSYGTKVAGTATLTAGLVTFFIGAVTWH